MKLGPIMGAMIALALAGCGDEPQPAASASATQKAPPPPPPAASSAAPVAKKPPRECPTGAEMTFDDPDLEGAVRVALAQKDGPIKKADLAKVKSLNLGRAKKNEALDPCVYPALTGLKELTLG